MNGQINSYIFYLKMTSKVEPYYHTLSLSSHVTPFQRVQYRKGKKSYFTVEKFDITVSHSS